MLFKKPQFILVIILFIAFLIRIFNLNFNSPFIDEATYIILGKKILDGKILEVAGSTSWMGGFPFFFPFISAIFFSLADILGSRFLNVILGTIAIFLIYLFSKQLKLFNKDIENEWLGLAAAAFVTTSAIPIYLSRLAIYDGLSIVLFLLSIALLQKASRGDRLENRGFFARNRKNYYLASAFVLFLSFLAKYFSLIFFPFFALLNFSLGKKGESFVKFFLFPLILFTLGYYYLNFESLNEFAKTQNEASSRFSVMEIFLRYTLGAYLLAITGAILIYSKKKPFVLGLLALSFLPFVVHFAVANALSVHQHTYFSIIFLAPLVAVLAVELIKRFKFGIFLVVSIFGINLYLNFDKVSDLESFWPNSRAGVGILKIEIGKNDKILAESGDVVTLVLHNKVSSENIYGPFVFSYKELEGQEAYYSAVADGFFNYVELDGTSFDQETRMQLEKRLIEKYSLIFDDGRIKIFKI